VTIAVIDQLKARFNADAYSGRVEGGRLSFCRAVGRRCWHCSLRRRAVHDVRLADYAEQVLSGANTFALAYGSKSVTDTRSELGIRTDKSFALRDSVLTLRGRFGWTQDFNPDRSIAATFRCRARPLSCAASATR
jgi:hypothetical protein